MREAVYLTLHRIDGYRTGEQADVSAFENEDNIRLRDALLMAFDPFTNPEVKKSTEKIGNLEDKGFLESIFKEPAMCLLRIKDSVDTWEKRGGSDGYFQFIEGQLGPYITGDKMGYVLIE